MKKTSKININKNQNKNELKNLINWFTQNYGSIRTTKLVDSLKKLGFKYSTQAGISLGIEDLRTPKIKKNLLRESENKLEIMEYNSNKGYLSNILYIEKVVQTWNQTNEKLREEIINNFRQTNLINPLYMMTLSGARGNISQIKQLVGMRGLISDSQGEIIDLPIKNNFKEGLNIIEYFISCYGARKGLVDTALKTANSGYLTRRLIYTSQDIIIKQPNCKTNYKNLVLGLKDNKKNYKNSKNNLLGRVLARDIKNSKSEIIASENQDICNFTFKKVIKSRKIFIRSPLTCKLNIGLCQLCYGWNLGNGRIAELGESVGIVAAQSIGEPGTQLTMRTFHTGGIFSGESNKIINSPHTGTIYYTITKQDKRIQNKYSEKTTVIKNKKIVFIKRDNVNQSFISLPTNSIIFPRPNDSLIYKQLIAEIPIAKKKQKKTIGTVSNEIKSPFSGMLFFHERKKKNLLSILSSNILEAKKFTKLYYNKIDKIKTLIQNKQKIVETERKGINNIKINLISIKEKFKKTKIKEQKEIFNFIIEGVEYKNFEIVITNKKKTEKELKKKNGGFLHLNKFTYEIKNLEKIKFPYYFNIIQKSRSSFLIKKSNTKLVPRNSKIKKEKFVKKNRTLFFVYHESKKTKDIVQGLPKIEQILEAKKTSNLEKLKNNPHEKLNKNFSKLETKFDNKTSNRIAIEKIQDFLTKKVQNVYETQGINIATKHIEIIVKQMTSRVIVKEKGSTEMLPGEIIELNKIEKINEKTIKKATYEPIILGITKLGINNQSFITASSFQETAKILTKAAIEGKIDWLNGLKENVILGKLIPAGTGFRKLEN